MNNALDLIPLVGKDKEFREAISPFVQPKLWKCYFYWKKQRLHQSIWICKKCGRGEELGIGKGQNCPIPDPYTGSLADLWFELRPKIHKGLLNEAINKVGKIAQPELMRFMPHGEWMFFHARIELLIIAALLALEIAGE